MTYACVDTEGRLLAVVYDSWILMQTAQRYANDMGETIAVYCYPIGVDALPLALVPGRQKEVA